MSYRYTTIDIIVGVGMCAIVFGALLFVGAANGMLQTATLQSRETKALAEKNRDAARWVYRMAA